MVRSLHSRNTFRNLKHCRLPWDFQRESTIFGVSERVAGAKRPKSEGLGGRSYVVLVHCSEHCWSEHRSEQCSEHCSKHCSKHCSTMAGHGRPWFGMFGRSECSERSEHVRNVRNNIRGQHRVRETGVKEINKNHWENMIFTLPGEVKERASKLPHLRSAATVFDA